MSELSKICGLKIVDADITGEYPGLRFEDGATLNIYNKFVVVGAPGAETSLIGRRVAQLLEEPDMIAITLDSGARIQIDMRDEAYSAPEALQLCVPDGRIIIWN